MSTVTYFKYTWNEIVYYFNTTFEGAEKLRSKIKGFEPTIIGSSYHKGTQLPLFQIICSFCFNIFSVWSFIIRMVS